MDSKEIPLEALMVRHLKFCKEAEVMTRKMLLKAGQAKFDDIEALSFERERVIKIVGNLKKQIHDQIINLQAFQTSDQTLKLLRGWEKQDQSFQSGIKILDQKLLALLDDYKSGIQDNLGSTYKNRSKIQGYNLNRVRK